jgi:hypothetical protein
VGEQFLLQIHVFRRRLDGQIHLFDGLLESAGSIDPVARLAHFSQFRQAILGQHMQLRAGCNHAPCGVLLATAQYRCAHAAHRQSGRYSRAHHARTDDGSGAEMRFRHAVIVSERSSAGVRAG